MSPSFRIDRAATVALVVVLLVAPAISAVPVTALPPSSSSYAVAQGTTCTVVDSVTENESVSDFYDYRNPNPEITGNPAADTYSSYGTTEYQRTSGSSLFFYTGTNGTSLVVVHDRLGDEDGGSTITGQFDGLPADGSWVVQDDRYPGRDDDWVFGDDPTTATIDWKWGDNRTDGGAYRGLSELDDGTITVDMRFNEEAAHWGDWGYSGTEQYRIESWTLWGADGSTYELELDRRVFIHQGGCVQTPPSASLSGPSSVNANESVTLDASGTTDNAVLGGYEWDFDGDGDVDQVTTEPTVDHTFTEGGTYSVTVTPFDTYGNSDTATLDVSVVDPDEPPSAALEAPSSAVPGETVTLDASDSEDDEGIVEYRWDVDGDGTVDVNTTEATYEHSYSATGTYEPTVTVVDTNGSVDSASATVEVSASGEDPTAALTAPSTATVNQSVTLDASDSTDDGGIVEYRWDVDGDGTVDETTAEATFEYTYTATGEYTPTVTVVDEGNATDTDSADISVLAPNQPPTANLTGPSNATTEETIVLDASSSSDDRGIEEYRWDIDGDGDIDRETDEPETEVTYEEANTFEPTVTVVDTNGETATATHTVNVSIPPGPPSASLSTPETVVVNESVTFDASESTDNGEIVEYRWDVNGDGTVDATTSTSTFEYTYNATGEYTPTVIVVDNVNETATDSTDISVLAPNQPPTANLTGPSNATTEETIVLDAGSSSDDRGIEEYRWDIDGDGEVDRTTGESEIEVNYDAARTFDPTVTVIDTDGESATATHTVNVTIPPGPPSASLSVPDTATVNVSVTLDASASVDDGQIVEYRWDVDGDGTVDANTTAPTFEHTYTAVDSYEPVVIVVDDDNNTDTAEASVGVERPSLEAAFAVSTSEPTAGTAVQFNAAGSTPADAISSYEWEFGDGDSGTGVQPQHTYETSGSYEVTLTVSSGDGTTATVTTQVTVAPASDGGGNDGGGNNDGGGSNDGGGNNDGGGSNDGGGNNNGGSNPGGGNNAGGGQQGGQQADQETPEPELVSRIETTNVSFNRRTLIEGQTLVVRATVENFGNGSGRKEVEFEVDDTLIESRTLTVAPNETRTVAFTLKFTKPGTKTVKIDHGEKRNVEVRPAKPNLSVTAVSVNKDSVSSGEEFTLSATVANNGHAEGTKTLRLELFNEVVAVENVTLAPDERTEVTFSRSIRAPGTYTATVGNASTTVQVTGTATETPSGDSSTETSGPGFSVVAVLLALVVWMLATRRDV